MNQPRADSGKIGERLKRALPEWCEAEKTRRELCTLLAAQFRRQPETAQSAVDEVERQVKDHCMVFAATKYGETERTREFGRMLGSVAVGALDIPQRSMACAAMAILRERERPQKNLQKARKQVEPLLTRSNVSPALRKALAAEIADIADAEKAEKNDPIVKLLRGFFMVKDGYWREFFDKRDQLRKKKHSNFPTMRERLVNGLLAPESLRMSPYAQTALSITRREALELAAICMKSAYPRMFPKSLDGESVRLIMQYYDERKRTRPEDNPRDDRT
jgi:hypothetical protein